MAEKWIRLEIHSGPDKHGRYVHTRIFLADYHPGDPAGENRIAERGQVFHSTLPSDAPIPWTVPAVIRREDSWEKYK